MTVVYRPYRDLCPEAAARDAMTDAEFWDHVFPQNGPEEPDYDHDPEVPAIGTICDVCGSDGACGYDPEGRPWIHCTDERSE